MIRVFPRKTKWTPTDDLAFVGDPPLFRPPDQSVFVSVTFTWDLEEARRLVRAWSQYYTHVQIGGPAAGAAGGRFEPGRFLKDGVVITSRGCIRRCPWCLVWSREGTIRELPVRMGYDVADNNLLACSRRHIERVFDMLSRQEKPARFSGGLDTRLFQKWHADLLSQIRLKFAWFACDTPGAIVELRRVAELMGDFSIEKKRCYVLVGYGDETQLEAEKRLEEVYRLGFLPFAQLYRGPAENRLKRPDWSLFLKKWCRPAAYRQWMKKKEDDHATRVLST